MPLLSGEAAPEMPPVPEFRDEPESASGAAPERGIRFHPLDYATMVGFLAYSSSVTATPICLVAISRELSLSLSQAGALEAVRSVLTVAMLLASGFVAALLGKARALGWSCLALGVGMVGYSLAPSYPLALVALAGLGLGGGVVEALINPLVQELHPRDSGRYLNLTNAFWSIGTLLTMLGAGELLTRDVSWREIMAGLGALSGAAGLLYLGLRRHGKERPRLPMAAVLRQKRAIALRGRFWLFSGMMFFGGAAEGAFTYWSASLIQLHHQGLPRAAGIGVALFAGGMIAARLAFGWLVAQRRLWILLTGSALAGIAVSATVPFIDRVALAYVCLFLAGVSVACFWPSIQSYAVDRMDLDPTALFILLSCGGVAGFASISWLMGWIGDAFDLRTSFWCVPLCLVALLGCLILERTRPPPEAAANDAEAKAAG